MLNRLLLFLCGLAVAFVTKAQNGKAENLFLDDTWQSYTITSPGYLGPNAFRIPVSPQGLVDSTSSLMFAVESHNTPGDYTQNIYVHLNYVFLPGVISVEAYGVPLEHYRTSDAEFQRRRVNIFDSPVIPHFDNDGINGGDYYAATLISVLNRPRYPQMVLRFGLRAPSGNLDAARFTDSPAFFTDLSAGKSYKLGCTTVRPSLMLGFLTWQTTDQLSFQNDAGIFGIGTTVQTPKYEVKMSVDGFAGYKKVLDQPVVGRLQVNRNLSKGALSFQIQKGLHHIKFTTFAIGFTYRFAPYLSVETVSIEQSNVIDLIDVQ